ASVVSAEVSVEVFFAVFVQEVSAPAAKKADIITANAFVVFFINFASFGFYFKCIFCFTTGILHSS
ncbi:MAG TPA: hypothetical protein DCR23_03890, partial [Ruminococcaceae bacterium]|nr:hypothetical protein [Oscillospiraceae bacterium]